MSKPAANDEPLEFVTVGNDEKKDRVDEIGSKFVKLRKQLETIYSEEKTITEKIHEIDGKIRTVEEHKKYLIDSLKDNAKGVGNSVTDSSLFAQSNELIKKIRESEQKNQELTTLLGKLQSSKNEFVAKASEIEKKKKLILDEYKTTFEFANDLIKQIQETVEINEEFIKKHS